MIMGRCIVWPELAPPVEDDPSWEDRLKSLLEVWPIPLLVLGVIGGIYSGLASATEAAALGAIFALLIGFFRRTLTWEAFKNSMLETLESSATIVFVAIGALMLTRLLAFCGLPAFMAGMVSGWAISPLFLILGVSIVYLILGCFLDPLGLLLLTLPVFQPMFAALKLDMIWVGVIIVKYIEIGLLTPPVGLNVYVVKGVVGDKVPLTTIFKGVGWFILAEAVVMTLLIAFPAISTWLPAQIK
jgi:C4-dicarboxylate transporter DctM subunit